MKILRYILIILLSLCLIYCITWYYMVSKLTHEVNSQYAGKKNYIKALVNSEEYFTTFERASMSGFPFDIAIKIHGWQEESRNSMIFYNAPIKIGYGLLSQEAYVSYNGDIDSSYKPVQRGFGAILKIKDYLIKVSIPFSHSLFSSLSKMESSVELLNYIKDINISTKEVQIVDKQEKELFYDKEYENLNFLFVPAKHYKDLQDLLNNIPKEYVVRYKAKTKPVKFSSRQIPISLFYGFPYLPADFSASAEAHIKTESKTFQGLILDSEIVMKANCSASKFSLNSFKLNLKNSPDDNKKRSVKLTLDSAITLKSGFFEGLFEKYEFIRPKLIESTIGNLINQEVLQVINNKDLFKLKDLEDREYLINLDNAYLYNNSSALINLDNFSVYTGKSGFKLTNESKIKLNNPKDWSAKGVLLLNNYSSVTDFVSNYIYRLGNFKILSDESRNLYYKINKEFLKQLSDYPASTSNDLSFDYQISLKDLMEAKFGSAKISQIPELYKHTFYKNLLSIIQPHGNLFVQVKKILPNLSDSEIEDILSHIKVTDENKSLQKEVKKVLPGSIKAVIE